MSTCDLCKPSPHQILWQDDFCRVVLLNDADYPAYCRVELLEHIKEMTDLAPLQRARMMKTVFSVELALREVTQADKMAAAPILKTSADFFIFLSFINFNASNYTSRHSHVGGNLGKHPTNKHNNKPKDT